MKDIRFIMAGILVLGGGAFFLLTSGAKSSPVLYYSVSEYYKDPALHTRTVFLKGKPEKGSTVRGTDGVGLSFALSQDNVQMRIRYEGVIPDAYQEGLEVVVEGKMNAQGEFDANDLVVKCPSKYEMDPAGNGSENPDYGKPSQDATPLNKSGSDA